MALYTIFWYRRATESSFFLYKEITGEKVEIKKNEPYCTCDSCMARRKKIYGSNANGIAMKQAS
jgi:hypothetical protein